MLYDLYLSHHQTVRAWSVLGKAGCSGVWGLVGQLIHVWSTLSSWRLPDMHPLHQPWPSVA